MILAFRSDRQEVCHSWRPRPFTKHWLCWYDKLVPVTLIIQKINLFYMSEKTPRLFLDFQKRVLTIFLSHFHSCYKHEQNPECASTGEWKEIGMQKGFRVQWKHPKSQVSSSKPTAGCFPVNMSRLHSVLCKRHSMFMRHEKNIYIHIWEGFWGEDQLEMSDINRVVSCGCLWGEADEAKLVAWMVVAAAAVAAHTTWRSIYVHVNSESCGKAIEVTWKFRTRPVLILTLKEKQGDFDEAPWRQATYDTPVCQ